MRTRKRTTIWIAKEFFHRLLVVFGAMGLTLIFFLVLPLMQTLTKPPTADLVVQAVDTGKLEAPDPPPEPEPEEEPEQKEQPPELADSHPLMDLSNLELALNPGLSDGWMAGDFAVSLNTIVSGGTTDVEALFSIADLDQKPRVVYQPSPVLSKEVRKKAPGTVYIIFVVDAQGRVEKPVVQKSTDPVFEKAALGAVKQWKFEPGKRNGKAVRFRMRVPITFPKNG